MKELFESTKEIEYLQKICQEWLDKNFDDPKADFVERLIQKLDNLWYSVEWVVTKFKRMEEEKCQENIQILQKMMNY